MKSYLSNELKANEKQTKFIWNQPKLRNFIYCCHAYRQFRRYYPTGVRHPSSVDLVAAEDTRHSGLLLSHYGIKKPFFALHDHNEQQKAVVLVEKLAKGENIALISDAGTPLISDPGFHLVRHCRQAGVKVVPIPGACAAVTALCASGIASRPFLF